MTDRRPRVKKTVLIRILGALMCAALTLNQFYGKFAGIRKNTPCLKHLIIATVKDALTPLMKVGYALTQGRKIPKVPRDADVVLWKDFIANGKCHRNGQS